MSLTPAQYALLIEAFRTDIPFFAETLFGSTLHAKQIEFVTAFRDNPRITFKGGAGFGKTHSVAICVFWGIICFDKIQINIFGPTEAQLDSGLWKEIGVLYEKMRERAPDFANSLDLNTRKLSRIGTAACLAEKKVANSDNPGANRGVHMDNNWVIFDEASEAPESVIEVLNNIFWDAYPKMCLVSNPEHTSGYFFDTWEHPEKSQLWVKITGKATDKPGLTDQRIAELTTLYGGPDTNQYRKMFLGEFPLSNVDGVIPRQLVLDAVSATGIIPSPLSPVVWGLDPAGAGGRDKSVLVKRRDNTVLEMPLAMEGLNTVQLADRIMVEFNRTRKSDQPVEICVDAGGLGEGVFDNLIRIGLPAKRVLAKHSPVSRPQMFTMRRDELWWKCREWFEQGGVSIPNCLDLIKELCLPAYSQDNGKIKVEDKASIRKKGRRSPDYADALCLTFASNSSAVSGRYSWNKPLEYNGARFR